MKKVLNINLGGIPFTIDEDAYNKMNTYFDSLEKYFSTYDNPQEILYDIEVRMAELFKENKGMNSIVSIPDVDEVIKILGTPEDLSKETNEIYGDNSGEDKKSYARNIPFNEYKVGKKLFRDTESKVIAGVCSGLSNYFGLQDPVWIRLIFAILIFSGVSPVFYLILMIIVPKAKTEADRKAMRGEPIDIDTIARSIDEEINNLSDQIQEFASSFKKKRKNKF